MPFVATYNINLGVKSVDFTSGAQSVANGDTLPVFNELGCHVDWYGEMRDALWMDDMAASMVATVPTDGSGAYQDYFWATDTAQSPINYDPVALEAVGFASWFEGSSPLEPFAFAAQYFEEGCNTPSGCPGSTFAQASALYPDYTSDILNEIYSWDPSGAPAGGAVSNVPCTQGQPNGIYPEPGSTQLPSSVATWAGLNGYPAGNPQGYPPVIGTGHDSFMKIVAP
jgi:hypothetical protein